MRQMFGSYATAGVADCDFEVRVALAKRNLNRTVRRREAQRVVEQISHGALKQVGVGINLSLTAATDRDVTILRDGLIKRCNFLQGRARIELLSRNRFTRRIHPRDEKQI